MLPRLLENHRIGLIGSKDTVTSKIYESYLHQIDSRIRLFPMATQLFIYLVEENYIDYPETIQIAKNLLTPFNDKNIDTLILGCTHFPYLKKIITSIMGEKVTIIDPAEELAFQVKCYITNNIEIEKNLAKSHNHRYFVSGDITSFKESAKNIFRIDPENISHLVWDNCT